MTPDLEDAVGRLRILVNSAWGASNTSVRVPVSDLSLVLEGVRGSSADADTHRAADGEVVALRAALTALREACVKADAMEELSDWVDGATLDDASAALELQYPVIWSPEQVAALEARQADPTLHPYTCGGNRSDALHKAQAEEDGDRDEGVLIPTVRGWVCPTCDYRQFWAHETGGPTTANSVGIGAAAEPTPQPTEVQALREALEEYQRAHPPATGEAVAWQRLHPENGWLPVDESNVQHYRERGQEVRALYAAPVAGRGDREAVAEFLKLRDESVEPGEADDEERLRSADAILACASASGTVPPDVVKLVIAARNVAFDEPTQSQLRALDIASEAFASRVPWDNEPEDALSAPTSVAGELGYTAIFNAIAAATTHQSNGIGVSVEAFTKAIGGPITLASTAPPPQGDLAVTIKALEFYRDAWISEPNGDPRIEGDASGFTTEPADELIADRGRIAAEALRTLTGEKG